MVYLVPSSQGTSQATQRGNGDGRPNADVAVLICQSPPTVGGVRPFGSTSASPIRQSHWPRSSERSPDSLDPARKTPLRRSGFHRLFTPIALPPNPPERACRI